MRFVSKSQIEGEKRLYARPFMQKLQDGREVSMKEVRDFMLSFLAEHETFSICSECPEYKGTKTVCCTGCPLHDMETGCTLRNTGCLGWTCNSLTKYLRKKGALGEFDTISAIFGGLDTFRGQYRIPDHEMIRLYEISWGLGLARAETVNDQYGIREETWTHEQETEAEERHYTPTLEGEGRKQL
jgi:hypothetical protein